MKTNQNSESSEENNWMEVAESQLKHGVNMREAENGTETW